MTKAAAEALCLHPGNLRIVVGSGVRKETSDGEVQQKVHGLAGVLGVGGDAVRLQTEHQIPEELNLQPNVIEFSPDLVHLRLILLNTLLELIPVYGIGGN